MNPRLLDGRDTLPSLTCEELVGNVQSADRRQAWHDLECDKQLALTSDGVLAAVAARPSSERMYRALMYDPEVTVVAVVTATTTRGTPRERLQSPTDTLLCRNMLSSFAATAEPGFEYWLYVAYDAGDEYFDTPQGLQDTREWFNAMVAAPLRDVRHVTARLNLLRVENGLRRPGPAFNFALRAAYEDGADYLYRVNDDTVMETVWAGPLVSALLQFKPPNFGVVGPSAMVGRGSGGDEGDSDARLLTHDMTHRTHMDVFGAHYYPAVLDSWWMDDWMTRVYGGLETSKARQQPLGPPVITRTPFSPSGPAITSGASGGSGNLVFHATQTAPASPDDTVAALAGAGSKSSPADNAWALWNDPDRQSPPPLSLPDGLPHPQRLRRDNRTTAASPPPPPGQLREGPVITIRAPVVRTSASRQQRQPGLSFSKPTRARLVGAVRVMHDQENRRYVPNPNTRHTLELEVLAGMERLLLWLRAKYTLLCAERVHSDMMAKASVAAAAAAAPGADTGTTTEGMDATSLLTRQQAAQLRLAEHLAAQLAQQAGLAEHTTRAGTSTGTGTGTGTGSGATDTTTTGGDSHSPGLAQPSMSQLPAGSVRAALDAAHAGLGECVPAYDRMQCASPGDYASVHDAVDHAVCDLELLARLAKVRMAYCASHACQ